MYRYEIWVVPNGQLVASLAKLALATELPGLNGMFTAKLRNIGGFIHTHNCSAGWMSPGELGYLMTNLSPLFRVYAPAEGVPPEHPLAVLAGLGYELYPELP